MGLFIHNSHSRYRNVMIKVFVLRELLLACTSPTLCAGYGHMKGYILTYRQRSRFTALGGARSGSPQLYMNSNFLEIF